ncbi:MAG TPA: phosphonate metabolism transcriptional regulator PhnF [Devosiaceae bacterium]|jgi:GntR family phosphonate transport system transcriptional regulator
MDKMTATGVRSVAKRGRGLLWKQIAAAISAEIEKQALPPGSQLETELQLAERFGVSRFTVRHALADLESQGLLRIEHGRGLFIAEQAIPFVLNSHMRFSDNLARLGLTSTRTFLEAYRDRADPDVAKLLEIAPDDEVVVVRIVGSINDRRIGLTRDLYPAARFAGIEDHLRLHPSPTAALRHFGITDYSRRTTRISSRMPDSTEAELLGIARTRPVLETTKVDIDLSGRPIVWGVSTFPADRVNLVVE